MMVYLQLGLKINLYNNWNLNKRYGTLWKMIKITGGITMPTNLNDLRANPEGVSSHGESLS